MGLLPINVCMWEEALKREKQCWHKNSTSNLENKILSNLFKFFLISSNRNCVTLAHFSSLGIVGSKQAS